MPIKGLVDERIRQEARVPGQIVRLGTISKGKREGFGEKVKLHDLPYFRFTPDNGDERLTAAFAEAYGPEPTEFDDVRIPVDIAGNFDILSCSWYIASRHTEKGSHFLARSDGENIKQMRSEEDGRKVDFFYDGERLHEDYTRLDNKGRPCFVYNGKLYPWQGKFAIDLIFPAFNRLVFERNIVGYGAITLSTTSLNDIPTLTKEYQSIIEELAGPFINPMIPGSAEQAKNYLPLRNFPIRLWRQVKTVGTPDYRADADPSDRLLSTRSLLHWQVSPKASAAIQEAIDKRTAALIAAAAQQSFLTDDRRPLVELEADLFPDAPQIPDRVETAEYTGPDWESLGDELEEGDFEDTEAGADSESEPAAAYDWQEAAEEAETMDGFCLAYFQATKQSGVFNNAPAVKKAFIHFFGNTFESPNSGAYTAALNSYVSVMADGGKVKDAKARAAQVFENQKIPF